MISLKDYLRKQLEGVIEEYVAQDGIGQYSHYRMACFLYDEERDLSIALLEKVINEYNKGIDK